MLLRAACLKQTTRHRKQTCSSTRWYICTPATLVGMRFTAFLCLFAAFAASAAAFPIKTREEQGAQTDSIQKTTLYDMIFGRGKVQKPNNKASGHPLHVHDRMRAQHQKRPLHNKLHVHSPEHMQETKK